MFDRLAKLASGDQPIFWRGKNPEKISRYSLIAP